MAFITLEGLSQMKSPISTGWSKMESGLYQCTKIHPDGTNQQVYRIYSASNMSVEEECEGAVGIKHVAVHGNYKDFFGPFIPKSEYDELKRSYDLSQQELIKGAREEKEAET